MSELSRISCFYYSNIILWRVNLLNASLCNFLCFPFGTSHCTFNERNVGTFEVQHLHYEKGFMVDLKNSYFVAVIFMLIVVVWSAEMFLISRTCSTCIFCIA
jgi:hypothetical protein